MAAGDFSHLASIFILLHKIVQLKVRSPSPNKTNQASTTLTNHQSCSGISFKSQVLYLIVYVTRYLGTLPTLRSPLPPTHARIKS